MLRRPLCSVCLLLILLSSQADARQEKLREVQDLRYGVMLYEYFQGNYFPALTELAVAREKGGMSVHSSHADLMEGGISLSYGMDQKAERIFKELLDGYKNPWVKDQAWFYLGKIAYQREEQSRALAAFNRIGKTLPRDLRDEYTFLNTNLMIRDGELDKASDQLSKFNRKSSWKPFAQFNLAVAQQLALNAKGAQSASHWEDTIEAFSEVGEDVKPSEEVRTLIDRAQLAAAFSLLNADRAAASIEHFKRVRMTGPYAAKAMLGYGWAAARLEDYELALTPWQNLSEQSLVTPAVQESYLAIPYAYEKLGAERQALAQFEASASGFEHEIMRLEQAIQTLGEADILGLFVDELGDEAIDWIRASNTIEVKPQTPYLTHLIARHRFQSGLQDLRDLYVIQENLQHWRRKIDTFAFAIDARRQAHEQSKAQADTSTLDNLQSMRASQRSVAASLDRIERERDALALLSGEQQSTLDRIDRASRNAASLRAAGKDTAVQAAKLKLIRGRLQWDANEQFAANLWQARKALKLTDQRLTESETRRKRLVPMLAGSADVRAPQQRVHEASTQLQNLWQKNEASIVRQRQYLAGLAIVELDKQRQRIRGYLAQARTSIARLYDTSEKRSAAEASP